MWGSVIAIAMAKAEVDHALRNISFDLFFFFFGSWVG